MMPPRVYLEVPYGDKDAAKAAGAKWDANERKWYAPSPDLRLFERWLPLPELPAVLAGEDRSFGAGLFVDMIPQSCWFTNVRSGVDERDWDRIRTMVVRRARQRCEICFAARDDERSIWLEVHERWEYIEATSIQRLRRLVCVCTPCHRATHLGLAEISGHRDGDDAQEHLRTVNQWTVGETVKHIRTSVQFWRQRSLHEWALDLSILTNAGIHITPAPPPAQRRSAGLIRR